MKRKRMCWLYKRYCDKDLLYWYFIIRAIFLMPTRVLVAVSVLWFLYATIWAKSKVRLAVRVNSPNKGPSKQVRRLHGTVFFHPFFLLFFAWWVVLTAVQIKQSLRNRCLIKFAWEIERGTEDRDWEWTHRSLKQSCYHLHLRCLLKAHVFKIGRELTLRGRPRLLGDVLKGIMGPWLFLLMHCVSGHRAYPLPCHDGLSACHRPSGAN